MLLTLLVAVLGFGSPDSPSEDTPIVGGICYHELDPVWLKAYCRHRAAGRLTGTEILKAPARGTVFAFTEAGLLNFPMVRVRDAGQARAFIETVARPFDDAENVRPELLVQTKQLGEGKWSVAVDSLNWTTVAPETSDGPVKYKSTRRPHLRYWFRRHDDWLLWSTTVEVLKVPPPTRAWPAVGERLRVGTATRGESPILTAWLCPQTIPNDQRVQILSRIFWAHDSAAQRGDREESGSYLRRKRLMDARLSLASGLFKDTESVKVTIDRGRNSAYDIRATWTAVKGSKIHQSLKSLTYSRRVPRPSLDRRVLAIAVDARAFGVTQPVVTEAGFQNGEFVVTGTGDAPSFIARIAKDTGLSDAPVVIPFTGSPARYEHLVSLNLRESDLLAAVDRLHGLGAAINPRPQRESPSDSGGEIDGKVSVRNNRVQLSGTVRGDRAFGAIIDSILFSLWPATPVEPNSPLSPPVGGNGAGEDIR